MYTHTQRSVLALWLLTICGAAAAVVGAVLPSPTMPLGVRLTVIAAGLFMVGSGMVFSRLTIQVDDSTLTWHFGPGMARKQVALSSIREAAATETLFAEGWGIHLTMRGWLYNVSGRKAVLITQRNSKRFMLGTDEPELLLAALRRDIS